MKIGVVIPWRETQSRLPLKNYVDSWYRKNLPDAIIVYSDSGHSPFNLSASRNKGAKQLLDYDIIIHNDADTIPEIGPLLDGINKTFKTGLFCNPYESYRSINAINTKKILKGIKSYEDLDYFHVDGACSGVIITTPKTWNSIGKFDENFLGWGYEDVAVALAHKAITSHDFLTIPGNVYGMSHAANETKDNAELINHGIKLLNQYFEASKDKESMLKLLGNRIFDDNTLNK
jgi:hypothetical protein